MTTPPAALCATCHARLYPHLARRTEAGWVHVSCPLPSTAPFVEDVLRALRSGDYDDREIADRYGLAYPTVAHLRRDNHLAAEPVDLRLLGGHWEKRAGGLRVWVRDDERQAS